MRSSLAAQDGSHQFHRPNSDTRAGTSTPAWRDAIQVVRIDLCSIYASAVRMPPRAT
jgi:hypothetical protein